MTHLVYGINDKYLPCLLVSIFTALKATSGPIDLTVFKSGGEQIDVDDTIIHKIASIFPNTNVNICRFETESLTEYSQSDNAIRWPPISMLPLFIPWLIEGKCLFLDADTLILKDLSELFEIDLNNHLIGATPAWHVRKYLCSQNRKIPSSQKRNRTSDAVRIKLIERGTKMGFSVKELEEKYISSGVIIYDTDKIRQLDPSATLMNLEMSRKHWFGLPDMDRLNEYFKDQVCFLDVKWNVYKDVSTNRRYLPIDLLNQIKSATKDPGILHFGGFYDSLTWARPWYKMRKRFRIYKLVCDEIEARTGVKLFQMFNSRS